MGGTCSTHGERRDAHTAVFWWDNLREGDNLEEPDIVDGRIIVNWIYEKWYEDTDWFDLA